MSKKSNFHPCLLTGYCFSYIPDFRNAIKKCFSYIPDFRNATKKCFSYIPNFRNATKKCFSYIPDFCNATKNIVSYTVNFCNATKNIVCYIVNFCNATNTKFVGCKRCGGFCFAFFYALRLNNSCYAEVIFHAKFAMVAKKQAR